jgi:RNA polymerase-interacting CarD/CdnL/TRCF family regulator
MFVKAKKILASELMYAKEMTEEQAAEWLDEVVARPAGKRSTKAKPKAAAATV